MKAFVVDRDVLIDGDSRIISLERNPKRTTKFAKSFVRTIRTIEKNRI